MKCKICGDPIKRCPRKSTNNWCHMWKHNHNPIPKYNTYHKKKFFKNKNLLIIIPIILLYLITLIDKKSFLYDYIFIFVGIFSIIVVTMISFKIMKFINNYNLADDLNLWLMRFYGAIFFTIAFGMILFGGFIINSVYISTYILTIMALFILGGFCELKSTRRYGSFIYLR